MIPGFCLSMPEVSGCTSVWQLMVALWGYHQVWGITPVRGVCTYFVATAHVEDVPVSPEDAHSASLLCPIQKQVWPQLSILMMQNFITRGMAGS